MPTRALALFFAAYFALGNVPRVLPIQFFRGIGVSLTEFALYFGCGLYIFFNIGRIRFPAELLGASFLLIVSLLWGVLQHGASPAPILYCARLIVALLSSFALGHAFFRIHGGRVDQVLIRYIILPLAGCTLIGWVIYLVFPDSVKLWLFLATVGIQFIGDPHSHRFISTFFDPQYYSCIAVMGMWCVTVLYLHDRRRWHMPMLLFLGLAVFLSLSRSGIATLVFTAAWIGLFRIPRFRLSAKMVALIYLGIVGIGLSLPLFSYIWARMVEKWTTLTTDASALQRLVTATKALQVFSDNPMMGVGYNYIPLLGNSDISDTPFYDSSLLSFLVTMGILGFVPFCTLFALFFARAAGRLKNALPRKPAVADDLKEFMIVYLVVVVIFTSQFDNVLIYQFWLIPVMALFSYFCCLEDETDRPAACSPAWAEPASGRPKS